jgi:hypothetical protein
MNSGRDTSQTRQSPPEFASFEPSRPESTHLEDSSAP